jgi:serine/threonine-protein kinase PknG
MSTHCTQPGCNGTIEDGYCDTCGMAAADTPPVQQPGASPAPGASTTSIATGASTKVGGYAKGGTGRVTAARRPTAVNGGTTGSALSAGSGSVGTGSRGVRRGSRGSSSRRRALGGGLVQMPVVPSKEPLALVMADPKVPASKCFCPNCKAPVNPDKKFCKDCGTEYNYKPSLKKGDVVAGQYRIEGAIAFGGLGWIYLGMDEKLNRWVVLKGLLNTKDEAAAAAAVAERQFLAAIKHGKIVGVYNFVAHGSESYIVMEYVGGKTLKEIRKEQGPMPVEEGIAYMLGILPAFGHLHTQNPPLVYCDFKPDNVMLENDDVKLIDMGAVRRVGDPDGDIYGTVGYMPPEFETDPTELSDLYTVARTLLALIQDFDITGRYRQELPPPNELLYQVPSSVVTGLGVNPDSPEVDYSATLADGSPLPPWLGFRVDRRTVDGAEKVVARVFSGTAPAGVGSVEVRLTAKGKQTPAASATFTIHLPMAEHESLYRFLVKATAANPEARFQNAEEMGAQLLGVLREIVAKHDAVPAAESMEFMGEATLSTPEVASLSGAWRRLPKLRVDQADPGAADVFAAAAVADPRQRATMLERVVSKKQDSAEALLRLADLLIDVGMDGANVPLNDQRVFDPVMGLLDKAIALDPFDWRPDWYCGKLYLSLGKAAEAVECFDKVYNEIPGELAPKLALALALETEARQAEAAGLYETVSRTDPAISTAEFGLARARLALGDRAGAVSALERIPTSSAAWPEAMMAAVRVLIYAEKAPPAIGDLAKASQVLEGMRREDIARFETEAALALEAVRQIEGGAIPAAAGKAAGATLLLGAPLAAKALRLRAESALLACARLASDAAARVGYVDLAHAVRPRTVI